LIDPNLFEHLSITPKYPQTSQQIQPHTSLQPVQSTSSQLISNQSLNKDHSQSETNPPSHTDMLETFSQLSLDKNRTGNRTDLPDANDEVTSTVRDPLPPITSSRP